jgi:hypothetical protein
MIDQNTRAARMGYATPAKSSAKAVATVAAPIYGKTKSGQAGSIDWALDSSLDRIEASHRDDPEKRALVRSWRAPLRKVLDDHRVDPNDAHAMLSTFLEHEAHRRSPEALEKRWAGPAGYEALRLEAGDSEKAKAIMESANRFYMAVKAACPNFAHNAKLNGSAESLDMIRVAARYGTAPATTETTKEN